MTKQAPAKVPVRQQKRRRKIASLDRRKAHVGWWFVLPFIVGVVFIYGPIIFESIRMSFCELKMLQGVGATFELKWVGLLNYQKAIFDDPGYYTTLIGGIKQLIWDIPAIVIFSLFMAVLLNQKMFGRAAFRAIFFIPVILATGLIAQVDSGNALIGWMDNANSTINTGSTEASAVTQIVSMADFSWLFENMTVGSELVSYVVGIINNIFNIINRSGVQMLVFLAGLQSISPAIYESCSIDGASGWETFWKITFPMLSPMILVNTIYTIIDAFTSNSNTVMRYIDKVYNQLNGTVISSAMAWLYFALVTLVILVVTAVLSGYIFYQKRD